VTADAATVTNANLEANNGVVHVVDRTLLPANPALTINEVITTSTSPQLSGTYDTSAEDEYGSVCILLRVNGVAYYPAITDGDGHWAVPAGTFTVGGNDFYTVVMRSCDSVSDQCLCDQILERVVAVDSGSTYGEDLLALTMAQDIVSQPVEEPEEPAGQVLGETTTTPVESTVSVGKGDFGDDSLYQTTTDDGSSDAEDTTQTSADSTTTDGQTGDNPVDDTDQASTWYWWFIGAGTVAVVWYALWRRQEA
jgi:hypothetical protein